MPLLKTARLEMFVEEKGQGSPVLFISGTGADLRVKPNVLDGPLAKNFRVIAYDQRGLGQTQNPSGPYEMEDYSKDAIALLDSLGIGQVHLVGVSFGNGGLAHCLAVPRENEEDRALLHFPWRSFCQLSVS